MTTEWYFGIRSPVQWGKYEHWHEAVTWSEEVYSKAYTQTTVGANLFDSKGKGIFGLTLTPWALWWDIAFLENLFYVWTTSDEEVLQGVDQWTHCNYTGWWFRFAKIYLDIGVMNRECKVGVHDYLDKDGKWACMSATHNISKAAGWKIGGFYKYEEGAYAWAPFQSCQEHAAFDRHEYQERSFLDAFKQAAEEVQEADLDDAELVEDEPAEDANDYDDYYGFDY